MLSSLGRKACVPMHQIHCFAAKCFPSSPLPSPRETHLWYVVPDEVKDAALLTQYQDLLSPCEKENIFSLRGEALQKRALIARALLRSTLSRYVNPQVSPRSLIFRKTTFGKPEVEWHRDEKWDPPSLHFNLSHTSSLIACGVTLDAPIGIDVEEKERKIKSNLSSFIQRYFSPHEVEYLRAIPDPEMRRKEFIKLWTLKEAYVKALGRGFSGAPFKTFTIRQGTAKPRLQVQHISDFKASGIVVEPFDASEDLTTNWKFGLFELASSHYASICVEDKSTEGEESDALKLKVWKTIPLVQDECLSKT